MKKIMSLLLCVLLLLPTFSVVAQSDISVEINGEKMQFDVMPIEENGRVLVPMRAIFEELGAGIFWDDTTWTVTAEKGDKKIILHVGSPYARVNKDDVPLDVPAKIVDGRTLVPVRFVAETLGAFVDWDESTNTVKIISSDKNELKEKFEGKKILFIGNSFLHYGRTVDSVNKKYLTLEERKDKRGGFAQIFRANGIDVSVVNWTISSHKLNDMVGANECSVCKNGVIHEEYLTDKYYDYVFFSPSSAKAQNESFLEDVEYIEKTFRHENPNVEIVCIGNIGAYGYSSSKYVWENREELYKAVEEKGIKVLDWGKIVTEIISGDRKVPGSTETYTDSTFVVKDGYHPNLLTGYITTLLAYCYITGESATGQSYSYIFDSSLAPTFDLPGYVDYYYKNGDDDTNFPEVLKSESEMKAIQQMVDEYLGIQKPKHMLDGKKVLFIGNSYTYYGRTVEHNTKFNTLEKRINDRGSFYQLCKENGAEVSVTNWTYSGHTMSELFGGPCTYESCKWKGTSHEENLTDRYYDYVFVSPTSGLRDEETTFVSTFEYIMKFFREANPDVKFYCLGNLAAYGINSTNTYYPGLSASYETLEKMGVTVADWGKLVDDIINGKVKVPGAVVEYDKNTFVVKDGHHPNMLAGYITTLAAYCAITGEKAEGQTYEYYFNPSLAPTIDIPGYVDYYYVNGDEDSTFPEVFNSPSDMKGIQQLVDEYMGKKSNVLDGKKIIFIGNSHTYYGRTVPSVNKKYYTEEKRVNNKGAFYELCKAKGAEVSVTNWTFGNHGLRSLFGAPCNVEGDCNGVNHEDYLTDRVYDYVVVTPGVGKASAEKIAEDMDYIVKFFKDANPNVKFVLLGNASSHGINATDTPYEDITSYYKTLEEQGFIVADWGKLVKDIINGDVTVPDAKVEYNKNTFIVKDGYHPNLLSGYITTLFTYCAITGESAVDLPYDFYFDKSLAPTIDVAGFVDYYYVNGDADSTFPEVINSSDDMKGIQKLVDEYLKAKHYLNY